MEILKYRGGRIPVKIIKGRLKGETGIAIGESNLNMDYRVIGFRDNPRARDKIMGFNAWELKAINN